MKNWKTFAISLIVLFLFSIHLSAIPYVGPVRFMEIPLADQTINFDGVDDEASWSQAQDLSIFLADGWTGTADMSGYYKVCWNTDYLFFYANITDDINHSFDLAYANDWLFDCAEVYIDLDTANHPSTIYDDRTIQLRFDRGIDHAHNGGRAASTEYQYYNGEKAGGDGWILEIGIPWMAVMPPGSLPEDINDYVGNAMGFDVMFSDSDNSDGDITIGNRDVQMAWDEDGLDGTEDLAWNTTSVFGIIELLTEPPPPAIPYSEPVRTLDIPARNDRIVLDGTADETSWSDEQDVSIFNSTGYSGLSDFNAGFRLSWDMEYLYFYADITDDVEHNFPTGGNESWMFDCVEFFIDLDTVMGSTVYDDNTVQLRFNRGDIEIETSGRAPAADFKYYWENKSGGDGWIIETAIPWTCAMPDGYDPDDINYYVSNMIGFDVNFSDSDNSDGNTNVGNRDAQAAWDADGLDGTEDLAWNNTHVFGIVALIGDPLPQEVDPVGLPYIKPLMQVDIPGRIEALTYDAEPDESFWSYQQKLSVFNEVDYTGKEDLSGGFKTAWDMDYLYLFATITDDIDQSWNSGSSDAPSTFDNLEVYLDMDTFCLDPQYRSNSTTMLRFCRGMDAVETTGRAVNDDFEYAWKNRDDGSGWQLEVAIPWTAALEDGAVTDDIEDYMPVLGFDIMLTDRDSEASVGHMGLTLATWDPDDEEGENAGAPLEDLVYTNTRAFGIAHLSPYTLGIQEEISGDDIRIYPNPASKHIYFENLEGIQRMEIITLSGLTIHSLNNMLSTTSVDISKFRMGIYLVRFIGKDGRYSTQKIIIE